MWEYTNLGLVS